MIFRKGIFDDGGLGSRPEHIGYWVFLPGHYRNQDIIDEAYRIIEHLLDRWCSDTYPDRSISVKDNQHIEKHWDNEPLFDPELRREGVVNGWTVGVKRTIRIA